LNVGHLVKRHYVRTQALHNGARLGRGATVGLADSDLFAMLFFPPRLELRVNRGEQLAGDVIGGVQ